MNHKLKYLKLFEGLSIEEIPYSKIDIYGYIAIWIPENIKEIPSEYNNLTDENIGLMHICDNINIMQIVGIDNLTKIHNELSIDNNKSLVEIIGFNGLFNISGHLSIENNESLVEIIGFKNLINIGGRVYIKDNKSLTKIIGFNNFNNSGYDLHIRNNPKLVTMSIPGSMIRMVDYNANEDYNIYYDNFVKFKSPSKFINSPVMYKDLVKKFNPGDHGDMVVKQIIENIEEWGTDNTKTKVYSFLGKHLTPEHWKLAPTHIQHRYNPDYRGTTGRDVAKFNAGEVYGIF